ALSTIGIEPLRDTGPLDAAIRDLGSYDWIVLTSVNGVHAFARQLAACGCTWDDRQRARIAVIGPATAGVLKAYGISPDLIPKEYVAEAILASLGNVA